MSPAEPLLLFRQELSGITEPYSLLPEQELLEDDLRLLHFGGGGSVPYARSLSCRTCFTGSLATLRTASSRSPSSAGAQGEVHRCGAVLPLRRKPESTEDAAVGTLNWRPPRSRFPSARYPQSEALPGSSIRCDRMSPGAKASELSPASRPRG